MSSRRTMKHVRRGAILLAGAALMVSALSACGSSESPDDVSTLTVGTTDAVRSIDPAGSGDVGSFNVQTQVYQYLLNYRRGSTEPIPDAAAKCAFTQPTEYTCTIKAGLTFANGHALTASDVAFSFNRVIKINDPEGPASLLKEIRSVEAKDDSTVVFTIKTPNDLTFPRLLTTSAGAIVDEQAYPADKLLSNAAAVKAQGFSGSYSIVKYRNQIAQFTVNPTYQGAYHKGRTDIITLRHFADSASLTLAIKHHEVDAAWHSLTPADIASLSKTKGVKVHERPGGELRSIVFNVKTMPGKDDTQKLAIRRAMATSIDRQKISDKAFKGTAEPAYSVIPKGQLGATESFKDEYGNKPDKAKAAKLLSDAGVTTPIAVDLAYNSDGYGSSSDQEYAAIKRQLEATGLFTVTLQSATNQRYAEERAKDSYGIFQLVWSPNFPDPDGYVTPLLAAGNILHSHYNDKASGTVDTTTSDLIAAERSSTEETTRVDALKGLQKRIASQVPILPLLTDSQIAVGRSGVKGLDKTLDPTYRFRFSSLSK